MYLAGLELQRVVIKDSSAPLDAGEYGALDEVLARDIGVQREYMYHGGNPPSVMFDTAMPTQRRYTGRDLLNKKAREIIAANQQRSIDFARNVLVELGFNPAVSGVAGLEQTPEAPAIEPPPVNWVNVAMVGIPLLRWMLGK